VPLGNLTPRCRHLANRRPASLTNTVHRWGKSHPIKLPMHLQLQRPGDAGFQLRSLACTGCGCEAHLTFVLALFSHLSLLSCANCSSQQNQYGPFAATPSAATPFVQDSMPAGLCWLAVLHSRLAFIWQGALTDARFFLVSLHSSHCVSGWYRQHYETCLCKTLQNGGLVVHEPHNSDLPADAANKLELQPQWNCAV
jgi:hypothetical protein